MKLGVDFIIEIPDNLVPIALGQKVPSYILAERAKYALQQAGFNVLEFNVFDVDEEVEQLKKAAPSVDITDG